MMKRMETKELHSPHVKALANRLITDIRQRGLVEGDRYLTAAEASLMLGVRKAMVGKAIQQLAERDILIPRQRSGTFVGPGLGKQKKSKVRTIYILSPAGDPNCDHWPFQSFIAGIRKSYPGVNVQFTFVPETDPTSYVQELIDESRSSGQFSGIVSLSCSPEVGRFLDRMRIPTVVYGSLYSSELSINSIDIDSFQCGRLLSEYLIAKGHRRLGLLMTGGGRPGDHLFLDGISEAVSAAGLPHNAVVHRMNHSFDLDAFRATAKQLLARADRPTAVITRGGVQASETAAAAFDLGLSVPGDLEIALDHEVQNVPSIDLTPFPRVEPQWTFEDIAASIGKLLKEINEGLITEPRHIVVPVEFHEPEINRV